MFVWAVLGIIAVLVVLFLILCIVTSVAYQRIFSRRYNGNPFLHYFTAEDFAGLKAEEVSFPSDHGQILRGYIYHSDTVQPRGVIIFSHGYGAGHQAYTTEINFLAQSGFIVLAYDGTGCVRSDGEMLYGFDQGPIDLIAAVHFAEQDERLKDYNHILVGHSWGAFSVMNALPNVSGVCCAVAMCGFISCAEVLAQNGVRHCPPLISVFTLLFRWMNRIRFGKKANQNSVRSLKDTATPVLLLYGEQDQTVLFRYNGKKMGEIFQGQKNIDYKSFPEKGHNVYLTCEAERMMHEQFREAAEKSKRNRARAREYYQAIDYRKITEEDAEVMQEVVAFCHRNLR